MGLQRGSREFRSGGITDHGDTATAPLVPFCKSPGTKCWGLQSSTAFDAGRERNRKVLYTLTDVRLKRRAHLICLVFGRRPQRAGSLC